MSARLLFLLLLSASAIQPIHAAAATLEEPKVVRLQLKERFTEGSEPACDLTPDGRLLLLTDEAVSDGQAPRGGLCLVGNDGKPVLLGRHPNWRPWGT